MPYLLLLLVVLFFSGNFIVARGLRQDILPVALSFWRWLVAFLILLPFSFKPFLRQQTLLRQHMKLLALLGLLGVTNFSTFVYMALQSTHVTNVVIVNATNPIFIVILSWVMFNDRISILQMMGIAVSLSGLMWIITQGGPISLLKLQFAGGDLWTLAATFSWALYTVLLRRCPPGLDIRSYLTAIFLLGLIFLLPLYLWEMHSLPHHNLNITTVSGILYLSIFPSLLAYIFWDKAVRTIGANKAGVFNYLIPVFSIILAFLLFDERFKSYHPPGILLIGLGIFMTAHFGKKNTPGTRQEP